VISSKSNTLDDLGDRASIDTGNSQQKLAQIRQQEQQLITAASLQRDTTCTFSVGLNIFEELSAKYHRDLKKQLESCILTHKPEVSFEDIAGNTYAKEVIRETFILPSQMPQLFKGKVKPWQSILLYGPPGVGKTMLT